MTDREEILSAEDWSDTLADAIAVAFPLNMRAAIDRLHAHDRALRARVQELEIALADSRESSPRG